MNYLQRFWQYIIGKEKFEVGEKSVALPVTPGGSAYPTNSRGVMISFTSEQLKPEFPIEFLYHLEKLSIFDEQISLALSNISIANTDFTIEFDDRNSSLKNKQMQDHLNNKMSTWVLGGQNLLTATLFRQLAVKGCISVDRVINKSITSIDRLEFINPYTIRFVRDNGEKAYPVQIGTTVLNNPYGLKLGNSYKYIPYETTDTSPYGIPLFLSIIEKVAVKSEMWTSFKALLKKIGVLGIYKVLVQAPTQFADESDQAYTLRVQKYIDDTYENVNRNSANGVLVGLKDQYEADIEGNNVNASGAEQLFKIINLCIYQGLQQDPNMMGESYTVSEAFAKVILKKMSQQHKKFQQRVSNFLEETFMMELLLAGFNPKTLKVVFAEAMPEDNMLVQQIDAAKIANVKAKIELGIMTTEQGANELGYDISVKKSTKSFAYEVPKEYSLNFASFPNKKQNQTAKKYIDSIEELFNDTLDKISIEKNKFKTLSAFQNYVLKEINKVWNDNFVDNLEKTCKPLIFDCYDYFRKDKSVFSQSQKTSSKQSFFVAPEPLPNFFDTRVKNFLLQSDVFYLGKFINDPDTVERLNRLIADYYNSTDKVSLDNFSQMIANELQLDTWKISRIINTTVNKIRSNAAVSYMQQAKVEKFQIIEVNDRITCPHCKHLNGMEFTVKNAIGAITKELEKGFENLPDFATANDIDSFTKLDSSAIEKLGVNRPPFHPNCRGTIGAVI